MIQGFDDEGRATASDLLSKIASVKSTVQAYGYTGRVITAKPPSSSIANSFLCTSSTLDVLGISAHSYFGASARPDQWGSLGLNQISITEGACGGKSVFVSEAGYPHAGITNGGNTPSYANQRIALTSLFEAIHGYVTVFTFTDGMLPKGDG